MMSLFRFHTCDFGVVDPNMLPMTTAGLYLPRASFLIHPRSGVNLPKAMHEVDEAPAVQFCNKMCGGPSLNCSFRPDMTEGTRETTTVGRDCRGAMSR